MTKQKVLALKNHDDILSVIDVFKNDVINMNIITSNLPNEKWDIDIVKKVCDINGGVYLVLPDNMRQHPEVIAYMVKYYMLSVREVKKEIGNNPQKLFQTALCLKYLDDEDHDILKDEKKTRDNYFQDFWIPELLGRKLI